MMKSSLARGLSVVSVVALSGCGSLDAFNFFEEEEARLSGTRVALRDANAGSTIRVDAQGAEISLPAPVANADWPQLNGNATRSIGHVAAGDTLSLAWTADVGASSGSSGRIVSPPVAAGGRVFALDAGATVSSYDASSGAQVWSVNLTPDGEDAFDGFGGGVAFDSGRVFVSNGFGDLHALAAGSGEIEWTARLGAPSRAAPVVSNGRVFAVTRNNEIIAVNASSGKELWREQGLEQSAGILGGAAPAATGDLVVVPFSSGELNAYAAGSGRIGWIDDLTGSQGASGLSVLNDVSSDPVLSGGNVFAASQSGRFVAVDVRSGERLWTLNIGGLQAPFVAGNTVFFVSNLGVLVAIEKETGGVIWTSELGGFRDPGSREDPITWAGPILAGGKLLLTSDLGKLVSVDPSNGNVLGEVDLPGGATNAPIVAGGTVYVLTDGATLAAYR